MTIQSSKSWWLTEQSWLFSEVTYFKSSRLIAADQPHQAQPPIWKPKPAADALTWAVSLRIMMMGSALMEEGESTKWYSTSMLELFSCCSWILHGAKHKLIVQVASFGKRKTSMLITHTHTHTHTHTNMHAHTRTHACTHTYTHTRLHKIRGDNMIILTSELHQPILKYIVLLTI